MIRMSDMSLLVPAFRERVVLVLADLQSDDYTPLVFETLRSKERAAQLVADGKSKAAGGLSMHCYGLAVDVICGLHQWDCSKHKCKFYEAYGAAAEKRGLTWGGRWTSIVDKPHSQAVGTGLQNAIRNMPSEQIDPFVRAHMAGHAE